MFSCKCLTSLCVSQSVCVCVCVLWVHPFVPLSSFCELCATYKGFDAKNFQSLDWISFAQQNCKVFLLCMQHSFNNKDAKVQAEKRKIISLLKLLVCEIIYLCCVEGRDLHSNAWQIDRNIKTTSPPWINRWMKIKLIFAEFTKAPKPQTNQNGMTLRM